MTTSSSLMKSPVYGYEIFFAMETCQFSMRYQLSHITNEVATFVIDQVVLFHTTPFKVLKSLSCEIIFSSFTITTLFGVFNKATFLF